MKLILNIGIVSLIFCVVCIAQNRTNQTAEGSQTQGAVGFQCPTGESNQPRPNFRIRLGDVTKKALELPPPIYPRTARFARISGVVKAEVVININTGKVVWARTLNGHDLLQDAVRDVVCRARFAPVNDADGYVGGIITYRFGRRK